MRAGWIVMTWNGPLQGWQPDWDCKLYPLAVDADAALAEAREAGWTARLGLVTVERD